MKHKISFASSLFFLLATGGRAQDTSSALFDSSRVWSIHLKFTAEQWAAMEPTGGFPPGGPGGPGAPGPGFSGFPGGPGPANMLAPAFLKGDKDSDGKLTRSEFVGLGRARFDAWDHQKLGKLTDAQLRSGIGTAFQPAGGEPGPMPPGPGGGPGNGMQGQNGRRNGMSAMMGIDFKYVHADLDFNGTLLKDVAVRYKGNSTYMQSRGSLKRSLKLDLNKYVKGQHLAGVKEFNLHSNVTDAGWMNEPLSYRLFRDGSVLAPRTSYARVYLTVAGKYEKKYLGLYSVVETIDTQFAKDRFSTRDGAILKPSTRSLFAYLGDDWTKYRQIYDPKTELSDAQTQRIIAFARLVTNASDAEFASQLSSFIDLDEFARYLAINVWLANMDSILAMGQNFYLYLNPANNKFLILPWDLDLSFGGMGGGTELSIYHPWRGENHFLNRLFQVSQFLKLYRARMAEFNNSIFQPERIAKQVDETALVIRPAVKEETDSRIDQFDKMVAGEATARGGPGRPEFDGPAGPGAPGGPGGAGGMPIKPFVAARAKSVAAQLGGQSKGRQEGAGGPPGMDGPGEFNPANFVAPLFVRAMDQNKDGAITRDEFVRGFEKWFDLWGGATGTLTEEQLRRGVARDLAPQRGTMPGPGAPPK